MPAQNPLKEYLQARALTQTSGAMAAKGLPTRRQRAVTWALAHWETLHKIWLASVASLLSLPVYAPYDDWKKFVALPVLTLFMIPFVALLEIPATLVLVAVMEWLRSRARKEEKAD